jgi:hypothetical protein
MEYRPLGKSWIEASVASFWGLGHWRFIGYPVVNCGFCGSRLSDCLRYVSRLVLRFKPAAVVLYAGKFQNQKLN